MELKNFHNIEHSVLYLLSYPLQNLLKLISFLSPPVTQHCILADFTLTCIRAKINTEVKSKNCITFNKNFISG